MMKDLSLAPHVDKMAMTLSGGNKRKLSLAIALMNSPPLVMLDEPSTGVDPAARRLMWDVVSRLSTQTAAGSLKACSVMLTTHNMEEAEALCSRIGIMVGGRLRCLGSNQHLKARFGGGYQLEARLRCPSSQEIADTLAMWKLGDTVQRNDILSLCTQLGKPSRAAAIECGSPEAYVLHEALAREGSISSALYAEWWTIEDRAQAFGHFLRSVFPGTEDLARNERTLRYRLPTEGAPLSIVFCKLEEEGKGKLFLEDYGLGQTSLEQIFDDFAARYSRDYLLRQQSS